MKRITLLTQLVGSSALLVQSLTGRKHGTKYRRPGIAAAVLIIMVTFTTQLTANKEHNALPARAMMTSSGWTPTGSLHVARLDPSATLLLDGRVLIAGGFTDINSLTNTSTAELYDPSDGTFSLTGSMTTGRGGHTATLLPNGKVLIAGGLVSGNTGFISSAELFDPSTGTFSPTGSLSIGRSAASATLLDLNGKVLIVGGQVSGFLRTSSAELYDPIAKTFATSSASLSVARYGHQAVHLLNGSVLITGGNSNQTSVAELYNAAADMFSSAGNLSAARGGNSITLLPSGQILVAGGNAGVYLATAELYNPAINAFSPTRNMSDARYAHTATLLSDGTVLVAGGLVNPSMTPGGNIFLSSAEFYDPLTATFALTSSLNTGRYGHTATLLPDARVLVAGGYNSTGMLTSAELFQKAPTSCVDVGSQPMSWWPGDGNARDLVGTNHGTLRNGATFAPGIVGQAFQLNGVGPVPFECPSCAYVEVPNNFRPSANGVTVEAWVRPAQDPASNQIGWVYTQLRGGGGGTFGQSGPELGFSDTGGEIVWRPNSDPLQGGTFSLPGALPPNTWTHIAGTYDQTAGISKLYLNGDLVGTEAVSGPVPFTDPAFIGKRLQQEFFVGLIDELSVYDRALSSSELRDIFTARSAGKCKCIAASIPTSLTGTPGLSVSVPINVTDLTGRGIVSYDFVLSYNPAVMQPQAPAHNSTGTLSSGMEIFTNASVPGEIAVSAFGITELSGAGTLLNLNFTLIGSAGSCGPLTLTSLVFNEGDPCVNTSAGQFCVVSNSIAGGVNYCTAPSPRAVPGVGLIAAGTPPRSSTSSTSGNYQITVLGSGPYTVTPSKIGNVNGISSLDASLVARYVAGAITLTTCQQIAGDASGDGTLTSFDASLIAQSVVGIPNPVSRVGTWRFLPANRLYSTLSGDLFGQNYSAVLVGEVSGNWSAAGLTGSPSEPEARVGIGPGTTSAAKDGTVVVTVSVSNLSKLGVRSYDFTLAYDPGGLELQKEALDAVGTLSQEMTLTANPKTPGRFVISGFAVDPLSGAGPLLRIRFTVVGSAAKKPAMSLESFTFNEGSPRASIN